MNKIKKLILLALSTMCAVSLAYSAVAFARYVFQRGNDGSITAESDLPIDILNKVEVNSQEDLFLALEHGYPYIALGEDVNDPLIITQDTMEVKKSLILDINGKEIQRVNEKAMLTVGQNVTLTIIDSKKAGCLYNPVGTVLNITGGTLDVRGGKFESGPRTWEYYSNTDVKNRTQTVNDVAFSTWKDAAHTTTEIITKAMPIIDPVVKSGVGTGTSLSTPKLEAVNGNIYYDVKYSHAGTEQTINADTYCYYVTSDNFTSASTIEFSATSSDFSYTYYAYPYGHEKQYQYMQKDKPATGTINADYVQVTVYGFENVIQTAMGYPEGGAKIGDENPEGSPYYATIKMSAGKLTVNCQGGGNDLHPPMHDIDDTTGKLSETSPDLKTQAGSGSFISYFGVKTASCIFFTGGTTSLNTQGAIATVDPKTLFTLYGAEGDKGNIIEGKVPETAFASEGRGICVHGHSDDLRGAGGLLTIAEGFFYSYNHNLVRMDVGTIEIDGDSKDALQFYKIHRVRFYKGYDPTFNQNTMGPNEDLPPWLHADGHGGIYSSGGRTIIGNARIYMACGTLTQTQVFDKISETYRGKQGVYGVYATGGEINLHDVDINVRGQGATGVASIGGRVIMTGREPTTMTDEQKEYYAGFLPEMQADMQYAYSSNIFVVGYNTKGILVQEGGFVDAQNTAVFVSRAKGNDLPSSFLSGVDVLDGNAIFYNTRIQSDGYGLTMSRGSVSLDNSRIASYNASAIVLGGGNMRINNRNRANPEKQVTAIKCQLTEAYVELSKSETFTGPTRPDSSKLLYTYAGIDILGGYLTIQSGQFDYTFESDRETPEAKDRIDDSIVTNGLFQGSYGYVLNSETSQPEYKLTGAQAMAPSSLLPAESNAIRVVGSAVEGTNTEIAPVANALALDITNTTCNITSNCGGGVLVRGGSVNLGSTDPNVNKPITIETTGKEAYSETYKFMGKDNWQYRDNKTGGDAMFVLAGNVTANTNQLTLKASHGNALLVTGSSCAQKPANGTDLSEGYKYFYDSANTDIPEVIINGGVFSSACDAFTKTPDGSGLVNGFNFTGPSSYYGVKVLSESMLTINGGNISGYGGLCTMGTILRAKNSKLRADYNAGLVLNGDYTDEAKRIKISCVGADAGGFYNNSDVTLNSTDKEEAKVKVATSTTLAAPENPDHFGLMVDGNNTCFVIEKYEAALTAEAQNHVERVSNNTSVEINGGFYCAKKGDNSGGKAFWCDNDKATLTIDSGWLIGSRGGGAIQGRLNACTLNGGYFINDTVSRGSGGSTYSPFSYNSWMGSGTTPVCGSGKKFYKVDCPTNGYYTATNSTVSPSVRESGTSYGNDVSAVYVE